MKRISLVFFLLTSFHASTWETTYPFNSIISSITPEWPREKDDRFHLKIHISGLLNLTTFTANNGDASSVTKRGITSLTSATGVTSFDSLPLMEMPRRGTGVMGVTGPIPSFFLYPELAVNAEFKSFGLEISALQIISATEYSWQSDTLGSGNSLNVYRINAQGMWQLLPWLEISTGYNHYLGYRERYDSISFAQAPSFSIGAAFEPLKDLKLSLLTHTPARLYFKELTDTSKLPLIFLADVGLFPTEKLDFFGSVRFSQVFPENQDADSTDDLLKAFGFRAGADFKPIPSVNLRLMGDYSASPLYTLEPLWSDEQGIVISLEGSWRKEPLVFSALIASGRYYASKKDGFNSNSYILRLGAAFEL